MSLDGREERLVDRMPHDPFSESLGIGYEVTGKGRVRSRARLLSRHRNALGAIHGALIYTMADTGMGRALATLLGPDSRCATITATVHYLEPVKGDELVAESAVVQLGAKVATTRCEVRLEDGTLCAVALGSFYVSGREGVR